jgi:acetyl esterase
MPCLQQATLDGCARRFQIGIVVERLHDERFEPLAVAAVEEASFAQHQHRDDWRGGVEDDQVDVLAELRLELRLHFADAFRSGEGAIEQHRQVVVTGLAGAASRLRAEQKNRGWMACLDEAPNGGQKRAGHWWLELHPMTFVSLPLRCNRRRLRLSSQRIDVYTPRPPAPTMTSFAQSLQNSVVVTLVGLPDALVSLLAGRPDVKDGQTLDPQLQLLLRLMAAAGLPRLESMEAEAARAFFRESAGLFASAVAQPARTTDRAITTPHGDLPIRIYVPQTGTSPHPVLVYYHGGGWTIGDLDTHDLVAQAFAYKAECIVVAVDYRMGPEDRFPASVDDALAAFAWAAEHASEFGGDPTRMAVAGDSAGGNLSAVVAQQTVARGLRGPDFQLLIYPVTDLAAETESYELFAEGYYLTRPGMRWFANNYVATDTPRTDPRISPLRAENLHGVAPAFVMTAGFDVLRDEGRAYAKKLLEAGVDVEYRNYESLIHGFISMAGVIREAGRAFDDAVRALRVGLGVDRED